MTPRRRRRFDLSQLLRPLLLLWLAQFVFIGTAAPFLHNANCPDSIGYHLGKKASGNTLRDAAALSADNSLDCVASAFLHAAHGIAHLPAAPSLLLRFETKPLLQRDEVTLVSAFSHRAIARGPPQT